MRYVKAKWTETFDDKYNSWGSSIWFFELDESDYPIRQVIVFSNGKRLKYDRLHIEDQYGSLGDQSIDEEDNWGQEIKKLNFEEEWKLKALNYG